MSTSLLLHSLLTCLLIVGCAQDPYATDSKMLKKYLADRSLALVQDTTRVVSISSGSCPTCVRKTLRHYLSDSTALIILPAAYAEQYPELESSHGSTVFRDEEGTINRLPVHRNGISIATVVDRQIVDLVPLEINTIDSVLQRLAR